MARPSLASCLAVRGAVFIWHQYPASDGHAKPKFVLVLNAFPPEASHDEVYFVPTTSQVDKLRSSPFVNDVATIPQSTYRFFPKETVINVASIAPPIPLGDFDALYEEGEVDFKGWLSSADVARIDAVISASLRVASDLKRKITAW